MCSFNLQLLFYTFFLNSRFTKKHWTFDSHYKHCLFVFFYAVAYPTRTQNRDKLYCKGLRWLIMSLQKSKWSYFSLQAMNMLAPPLHSIIYWKSINWFPNPNRCVHYTGDGLLWLLAIRLILREQAKSTFRTKGKGEGKVNFSPRMMPFFLYFALVFSVFAVSSQYTEDSRQKMIS